MTRAVKLSEAQRRGLRFLTKPWKAAWWAGKPHAGWPRELNARSFDALRELRLIAVSKGHGFARTVTLTDAGRLALKDEGE